MLPENNQFILLLTIGWTIWFGNFVYTWELLGAGRFGESQEERRQTQRTKNSRQIELFGRDLELEQAKIPAGKFSEL